MPPLHYPRKSPSPHVGSWHRTLPQFFQSTLHSILSNRILLLILKQRRSHRRYPTEELYSGDVELSDITQ